MARRTPLARGHADPPSPPPPPGRPSFLSSPYDAEILALAGPTLVALAADPLLSVVDTVLAGRLGPGELAALGLNSALFTFSFVVFSFLASATTPLIAAADAAGDKAALGRTTLDAASLALGLGAAVAVALWAFADPALSLMGAPPVGSPDPDGVREAAKAYLFWRAGAAPAALAMTAGQGVCRGLRDGRTPLAIAAAANGAHALLAPALMFGPPHMGVSGAAAATFLAEWGAAAAYGVLLWRGRGRLGLDPRPAGWRPFGWKSRGSGEDGDGDGDGLALDPFAAAGGAVLARSVLLLGTKTLAAASAARLGTAPLAAHQVLMQLWLLTSFAVDSLAVSGQALVAGALSRGERSTARGLADRLLQLGVAAGAVLAAALLAGGRPLRALFTADPAVDAALAALLPLAVGVLPLNAAVYVLDGVLLGARDFGFLAGAMAGAAGVSAAVLLTGPGAGGLGLGGGGAAVTPPDPVAGLTGVWVSLVGLMVARLVTLGWRYQSAGGPVPPVVDGE